MTQRRSQGFPFPETFIRAPEDVTFLLTNGGSVKAHKKILASGSEVFKALFSSSAKKSVDEVALEGLMPNCTTQGFQTFINMLYGTAPPLDRLELMILQQIHGLALRFRVNNLDKKIMEIIENTRVTRDNFLAFLPQPQFPLAFSEALEGKLTKYFHTFPGKQAILKSALSLDLDLLEFSLRRQLPGVDIPGLLDAYRKFLVIKV